MSDWSTDTTLIFLEAYQQEECIWNPKHVDHKNRKKVNDAWARHGDFMKKDAKELKNKKEILMATFRRHLNKKKDSIRSGAGADDIYKPIWFAYDLMESFLLPVYTSTENINTERESSSQETLNADPEIEVEEIKNAEIKGKGGEEDDLVQASTSSQTPKPVTSRRRPATDLAERQMSSAFGQLTNILAKKHNERPPLQKEDDDCDLYSKLLAKKLRELSPDERKLFMYEIDTLFINRIKENRVRRETPSPHYSAYYGSLPNASPIPYRSSTSLSSYSAPLPNPSLIPHRRPSTSQTSYSEPLPHTSPIQNLCSTSQTSKRTPLPKTSPIPNRPETSQMSYSSFTSQNNIQTYCITQPDPSNFPTPTIHISSNEVLVPPRQNIIDEAFLKAYEDFESS